MGQAISSTADDWARYIPNALQGVQLLQAHFLNHKFERHSHAEFSFGVTHSGVQSFSARGSLHHSQPGNIVAFNPEVAHDGMAGHESGFGYQMVYVPQEVVADWCTDYFADRALRYVNQPQIDDIESAKLLQNAFSAMAQSQESLRAQSLLAGSIMHLLSRHGGLSAAQSLHSETPPWIVRVKDYIQAHYCHDITADELATIAGVSRIHLNRVFTQITGSPPHAYLNTLRIRHAQLRLLAGDSAINVASDCGFADQSHMIRRFKGSLGITPKQWQMIHAAKRP
jgi:AraC-like DNA-binding protein